MTNRREDAAACLGTVDPVEDEGHRERVKAAAAIVLEAQAEALERLGRS